MKHGVLDNAIIYYLIYSNSIALIDHKYGNIWKEFENLSRLGKSWHSLARNRRNSRHRSDNGIRRNDFGSSKASIPGGRSLRVASALKLGIGFFSASKSPLEYVNM